MASNPIVISRHQSPLGRMITQLTRDLGAWLYVGLVLALASVLAFVYLAQASYAARQIDLMVELEKQLVVLHEENSVLQLDIATYEEMSRIKTQARAMGLGEATRVEYIEVLLDEPAAQGKTSQSSAIGSANGGQSSAPQVWDGMSGWPGVQYVSVIARQFQNWISRGIVGLGAQ